MWTGKPERERVGDGRGGCALVQDVFQRDFPSIGHQAVSSIGAAPGMLLHVLRHASGDERLEGCTRDRQCYLLAVLLGQRLRWRTRNGRRRFRLYMYMLAPGLQGGLRTRREFELRGGLRGGLPVIVGCFRGFCDGAFGWLEFLEGPRFESSRQNLPEMTTFLKRYFSDTANASAPMSR